MFNFTNVIQSQFIMRTKAVVIVLLLLLNPFQKTMANEPDNHVSNSKIRLAVVNTPGYSGLLEFLLTEFRTDSGYAVDIYSGSDVYERAIRGEADLVISHYGKRQVERFVLDGNGSWPKMVFFNQAAIIGPKNDPAKIRGLKSATEALTKIYQSRSKFIENPIPVVINLTETLWYLAGQPDKENWWVRAPSANGQAARFAEENKGYFIWGAIPFLRFKNKSGSQLEILVSEDPILQRVMSSIVVNSKKFPSVNSKGAKALQDYLLSPKIQAKIAQFRMKDFDMQLWWPAGRNN